MHEEPVYVQFQLQFEVLVSPKGWPEQTASTLKTQIFVFGVLYSIGCPCM